MAIGEHIEVLQRAIRSNQKQSEANQKHLEVLQQRVDRSLARAELAPASMADRRAAAASECHQPERVATAQAVPSGRRRATDGRAQVAERCVCAARRGAIGPRLLVVVVFSALERRRRRRFAQRCIDERRETTLDGAADEGAL